MREYLINNYLKQKNNQQKTGKTITNQQTTAKQQANTFAKVNKQKTNKNFVSKWCGLNDISV